MIFKIERLGIIIFFSAFIFNNSIQTKVELPDLENKIKNEYKREIAREIFKAKCLRYAAIGTTTLVLYKLLFNPSKKKDHGKKKDHVVLEARQFDDKKIDKLNNMIEEYGKGTISFKDNVKNNGIFDFFKSKTNQLYQGTISTAKSLVSSLPLLLSQYYMVPGLQWLLYKHDIKWIIQRYNVAQMLSNLKLKAVSLDLQSPILNLVNDKIVNNITDNTDNKENNSVRITAPYFDELLKLKVYSQAILLNSTIKNVQVDAQIQDFERLSNKFVDAASRILSYLYYQEDQLMLANTDESWSKYKDLHGYTSKLFDITNQYCNNLNVALENYKHNEVENKNILSIIFEFNNLFDGIISSIYDLEN